MIIKKLLETVIELSDPNDMFLNIDDMLIQKLYDKFVGVCYQSSYIIKINRIIRRSYIFMQTSLDGNSQVNVKFEVDALTYITNEIINGCTIVKKEPNGIIHAKSKYAGIQMSIQQNMSIFKENDIVPVIVKRVRYNINNLNVSVLAVPFTPIEYKPVYYKLNGKLSDDEKFNIKNMISQINKEETKIKKLNVLSKKIFNFFVDLQYNPTKTKSIESEKKIQITDLLDIKTGYIYKPNNKKNEPYVYHTTKNIESSLDTITGDIEIKSDTKDLGVEPLSKDFNFEYLYKISKQKI